MKARQKAKVAENSSDINTDIDERRNIKRPHRFIASSDEEVSESENCHPRPPKIIKSKTF